MGHSKQQQQQQQQAIDLLCTYGGRMRAESSHCCEGGRGVGHAARRGHDGPFLLLGGDYT